MRGSTCATAYFRCCSCTSVWSVFVPEPHFPTSHSQKLICGEPRTPSLHGYPQGGRQTGGRPAAIAAESMFKIRQLRKSFSGPQPGPKTPASWYCFPMPVVLQPPPSSRSCKHMHLSRGAFGCSYFDEQRSASTPFGSFSVWCDDLQHGIVSVV